MEGEPEIAIGDRIRRREDIFQAEEEARRERARFPLEEKIRILVASFLVKPRISRIPLIFFIREIRAIRAIRGY
ncbi:MAG: hypothetical protein N3B68_01650 [Anaerolineae bacterium]|nr:hypothetical protein [Anaerolineae bacterium]